MGQRLELILSGKADCAIIISLRRSYPLVGVPERPCLWRRHFHSPRRTARLFFVHVLLFDIDGTLLASGGAGKAAIEAALLAEFGLPGIVAQVPFSGRTDRAIGRELLRVHGVVDSPENTERLLAAYLQRLPACLGSHRGR